MSEQMKARLLKRWSALTAAGLLVAGTVPGPATAHHSAAMFDASKTVTITGTVKEMEWTNPHSWLHVIVDDAGKQTTWDVEFGSPNNLMRQGLRRSMLPAGAKISVTIAPLRNGKSGGQIRTITLADGKTIILDSRTRV